MLLKGRMVMTRNDTFPVLSNFALVLRVLGWVLVIGGGVVAIIGLFMLFMNDLEWGTLIISGSGVLIGGVGVMMIVLGEMVGVFFSIESNGAQLLQLERLSDRNRLITGEGEAA